MTTPQAEEELKQGSSRITDSFFIWLVENGFFKAPASTKYHGNCEGGLHEHSSNVARILQGLTKDCRLTWQRPDSPFIIGMFHDLCKIDAYVIDELERYEHNSDTLYKGHGDKSILLLAPHIRLTEEEVACIRYHMGAFTPQSEWEDYTRAIHKFPNVLWTHQADMIATHIWEYQ